MRNTVLNPTNRLTGLLAAVALCGVLWSRADEPAPAWPRRVVAAPYTIAVYEPAVEAYDQDWLTGHAAVSVATAGAEPVFGAAWFGLRLTLNADKSLGRVAAFRLDQARFPEGGLIESGALERLIANGLIGTDLAMAPLLQSLERERAAADAAAAGNEAVPDILFTTVPVALVRVDGEPELRALPGTDLLSVVNSTTPILLQKGTAKWFMQIEGRWLMAAAVTGPWQDVSGVPESVQQAFAAEATAVPAAPLPQVVVVTRATEVIQTDGEPRYTVIVGTDLLYVNNTDADVFLDIGGQKHYALLAGRWFAALSLEQGPWETVAPERLPKSFAAIPPASPKYGVLAHVPGTVAAQEAVQDAVVPRVQSVKRDAVTVTVEYEGEPEFVQAGQTTVYYAVNTPYSVVRVDPYYYLCYSGVWYYGASAGGPWTVCVSVPGVIYTIPPACPVYPVTYVRVYDWTPDVVYFGFTAGYVGWYVGWSGLVFGLSYYDDDWWHHHHRGHYQHNYHCGYRPYHVWRPGPTPHLPRAPRVGGRASAYVYDRPGPEYHVYGRGKPQPVRGGEVAVESRPTRYRPNEGPLNVGRKPVGRDVAGSLGTRVGKPDIATPRPGVGDRRQQEPATRPAAGKPATPVVREATPAGREPGGKPATPVIREATPAGREPGGKPATPMIREAAPAGREPGGKPATPVIREVTPASREPAGKPAAPVVPTAPTRERTAPVVKPAAPTPNYPAVPRAPSTPKGGTGGQKPAKGINSSFFEQRQAESEARAAAAVRPPAVRSPVVSTPVVSTPVVRAAPAVPSPAVVSGGATRTFDSTVTGTAAKGLSSAVTSGADAATALGSAPATQATGVAGALVKGAEAVTKGAGSAAKGATRAATKGLRTGKGGK